MIVGHPGTSKSAPGAGIVNEAALTQLSKPSSLPKGNSNVPEEIEDPDKTVLLRFIERSIASDLVISNVDRGRRLLTDELSASEGKADTFLFGLPTFFGWPGSQKTSRMVHRTHWGSSGCKR